MIKIILYLLSIFLISIGILFIIINLNLLTLGYTFSEYVNFIIRSIYFYYIIIGIIIIYLLLRRVKH